MIEFRNVTKSFKSKTVLNQINLTINKGELIVLIGPSGCGKTTTLKMINKLIAPTSGDIYIDGESILKADTIELRRNMGYVIQQTGLFPHMTVGENIGLVPNLKKWDKGKIKERIKELLELVGMDPEEYVDRFPSELSGGQQQRVGVARAFANNPEIILMDEPFSALDPLTRTQLQDELFNLQQKLKKTIVFVTHDMDEALRLGDRICIMKDGGILQFDTPEQILKKPAHGFVEDFLGKSRIWSKPEFIKAEDIMIKDPVITTGNRTLIQALEIIKSNRVDSLLIVNESNNLEGIASLKAIQSEDKKGSLLSEIMEKDIATVNTDNSILDILKKMNELHTGYIPVIDHKNKLAGLITRSSLLATLSSQYLEQEVNE